MDLRPMRFAVIYGLDFSNEAIAPILPPEFPEALRTRIMVNADQWDGFPVSNNWWHNSVP
jgi:hypothetical protein